jgi:hypothetical protein
VSFIRVLQSIQTLLELPLGGCKYTHAVLCKYRRPLTAIYPPPFRSGSTDIDTATDLVVGISSKLFSLELCNTEIEITSGKKTTTAVIVDACGSGVSREQWTSLLLRNR